MEATHKDLHFMINRALGCTPAYANSELRFRHLETEYLSCQSPTEFLEMSDASQSLSSARGLASTLAVMIAGPRAVPAPGVDAETLRSVIYHEHQKFEQRKATDKVIERAKAETKSIVNKDSSVHGLAKALKDHFLGVCP